MQNQSQAMAQAWREKVLTGHNQIASSETTAMQISYPQTYDDFISELEFVLISVVSETVFYPSCIEIDRGIAAVKTAMRAANSLCANKPCSAGNLGLICVPTANDKHIACELLKSAAWFACYTIYANLPPTNKTVQKRHDIMMRELEHYIEYDLGIFEKNL
jgi:hypothetical protein